MAKKYLNFTSLTLLTALGLSSIAAWFAIVGLIAIFPAQKIAIIVMGSAIEIGKVVATVWLRKYWARCGFGYKTLLIPMVIILMTLTSMGTFGFLSAAHSEQSAVSGDVAAKVSLLDEKIKTQRENADLARKALAQLDAQVEARLARGDSEAGAERAVQIRRQQAGERNKLQQEIAATQAEIARLNETRAPIAAQLRKVEAEVGPIKYIAALLYGETSDANVLERAVRWVIIMLVIVFDPLAIALVLAANASKEWDEEETEEESDKPDAWVADVGEKPTEEELKSEPVEEIAPPVEVAEVAEVVEPPRQSTDEVFSQAAYEFNLADHPYLFTVKPPRKKQEYVPIWVSRDEDIKSEPVAEIAPPVELTLEPLEKTEIQPVELQEVVEPQVEVVVPFDIQVEPVITGSDPVVEQPEPMITYDTPIDSLDISVDSTAAIVPIVTNGITEEIVKKAPYTETVPGYVVYEGKQMSVGALRGIRPELFTIKPDAEEIQTGFGVAFPRASHRGDIFVRIDVVPNRVYKFDGADWIEISKAQSDAYIHDNEYIKFLIQKIDSGEYDVDMLTDREREQISEYLTMIGSMLGQNTAK
jgi:hypothetical protein